MKDNSLGKKEDGRRARSAQSREKIKKALWDLMHEGIRIPTAQQVSDKASVGIRSVFRHFDDMEGLFNSINDNLIQSEAGTLEKSVIEGSLEDRLDAALTVRHKLFTKYKDVILFTLAQTWKYKALKENYAGLNHSLKSYLHQSLPELESLPADQQQFVEALTSFDMWHRLIRHQGMESLDTYKVIKQHILVTIENQS